MAKKILKTLTNNLGFKLLAVALAFIFWLVVYNIEDPVKKKTYKTNVTIENADYLADEMNKCYEIVEGSNEISFSVSAKRSILEKLDDSDFSAVADFNNIVTSDDGTKGYVRIDVTCNKSVYANSINYNTKIGALELMLEDRMEKQFKVYANTEGTVADGFALGEVKVTNPNVLTVSGPESIVEKIDRVVATINVKDMYGEITNRVIAVLYDKDGNEIPTTRLKISNDNMVSITAQILGTKELPIILNTSGTPAANNEVQSVKGSISSVLVKGSASALNQINSIEIPDELLDVTGATDNITKTFDITEFLPDGVSLVNAEDANVIVEIKIRSISNRNISLSTDKISVIGLPDNYELEFEKAVIEISVTGATSDLSGLTADKIQASIDVSTLELGTHTVTVTIKLDQNKFTCKEVAVTVTLREKEENDTDITQDEDTDTPNEGEGDEPYTGPEEQPVEENE